jgi:hypothetical protein
MYLPPGSERGESLVIEIEGDIKCIGRACSGDMKGELDDDEALS